MLKKVLIVGSLTFIALFVGVTLYFSAARKLVQDHQVVESEGHRQREYKIYGVIPYEKQESAPDVHVNADYWREIGKTGLKVGPEVDRTRKDLEISRVIRPKGPVEYCLHTRVKGDMKKLAAYYNAQIKTPVTLASGTFYEYTGPTLTTGKDVRISFYQSRKGAKPGEDEIQMWFETEVP